MGGYGGATGKKRRLEDGCYYDSEGGKVTDKNVVIVADYYLYWGMSLVFLHEKPQKGEHRPDLLVDYEFYAEVKGIGSIRPGTISKQLKEASRQLSEEMERLPEDKRLPGKIVILSLHKTFEVGFQAINAGYQEAKRKNQVHFQVEFWFQGEIHILE